MNGHRSHQHPSASRCLIVNADDFGLSDGVTEGILRAWRDGIVTSTSVLINIDGAPEQVAAAHAAYPDLPMGLHLNITTGRPVLPPEQVPTLIDSNGNFYASDAIIERLPTIALSDLRAELDAQARRFTATGVPFDHLDYHQHILALYTPFYPLVRELARSYGVPVRQPVPESVYGRVRLDGKGSAAATLRTMIRFALRHPVLALRLMPSMTPAAYKRQAALLKAEGIGAPDWFIDSYFGHATVENFIALLRQLPPGSSEVMVHPAIVDEQLRQLGAGYVAERAQELVVLLDPRVREALAAYHVQLVNFSARM